MSNQTAKVTQTIKFSDRDDLVIETAITGGTVIGIQTAVELGVITQEQAKVLRSEQGAGTLLIIVLLGLLALLIALGFIALGAGVSGNEGDILLDALTGK